MADVLGDADSLSDDPFKHTLELKLSDLAALWRENKTSTRAETVVRQYQAVLRCLIELGFREALDADSELPNRLMPSEYLDLFNQS
jgi:hypothetical protein